MKDDQDNDLVQKLLSHDEDVPVPPEHEQRIRAGLAHLLGGLPSPGSPPSDGGPPPQGGGSPPPTSPLGKWLATTALVAGAAAGGGFLAGRATAPVTIVAPPSSTPVVTASPTPSPTPCAQDLTPPPKPSVAPSTKPTSSAPATASGTNAQDAFDKEQSLLERARSALVRHDATEAERALDECEKQFPKSRHAEERDYLHIQVAREKGDTEKTRTLAKSFLTKYPQSILKTRVEALARP